MQRAIKDLSQLSRRDLYVELSKGLRLIAKSVSRLSDAARSLWKSDHFQASNVVADFAAEEAGKALVLVDCARCPQDRHVEFQNCLKNFYDHVAKGIYAEVCDWRPVDFAELIRGVERLRQSHYLDGPNDVDWVFSNEIERRREENLYVNFFRSDSDGSVVRFWSEPRNEGHSAYFERSVVRLIRCLSSAGLTKAKSLQVLAELWPRSIESDFPAYELAARNQELIRNIRKCVREEDAQVVVQYLPFPLWQVELRKKKVETKELKEIQDRWMN